jgi:hypothetical protein
MQKKSKSALEKLPDYYISAIILKKIALENTEYHEYKRESVINPDIEPFKDYIVERLLIEK